MRKRTTVFLSLAALGAFVRLVEGQTPTPTPTPTTPNPCPNQTLSVSSTSTMAPDTCVSLSNRTQLTWTETSGSSLTITIPDWTGTTPAAWQSPYTSTPCTTNTCRGTQINNAATPWSVVRYSLRLTGGKTIYGRIIINP